MGAKSETILYNVTVPVTSSDSKHRIVCLLCGADWFKSESGLYRHVADWHSVELVAHDAIMKDSALRRFLFPEGLGGSD